MKLLRSLFRYAALILIVGGIVFIGVTYVAKKEILVALVSNTIVKSSMSVLKTIAMSVAAIFLGLILLMISMKLSSSIRKAEREKKEELRQQQKENEKLNRELKKEAEEARKEAEQLHRENELMKASMKVKDKFTKKGDGEDALETEE